MTELSRKGFLGLMAAAAGFAAAPAAAQTKVQVTIPQRTLIRGCDVLTMDRKAGALQGVDVLIENGKIAAIGKDLKADNAEIVQAAGMILMPGMVDGHRHTWQSIHLGHAVKTEKDYGAKYMASKLRYMVALTPDDMYLANYVGGLTAISSGVTSVLDYAHAQHTPEKADAAAKGLKDSGIAGVFCWQISHTPSYGPNASVPLAQGIADRKRPPEPWRYEHAAKLRDAFFSDSSAPLRFGLALSVSPVSLDQQRTEILRCRELGARKIVQHWPPEEAAKDFRGIADLAAAKLMGPDLQFDHANGLTDAELKILAESGASCCASVMGEFPYAAPSSHWRARAAGVAACIGIDVPIALTNDYFEQVRAAYWGMYRTPEGAAAAAQYESEDVLDYATVQGARALRQEAETGTVAVGKRADVILLRTDRLGFAPHGSLANRVLNFAAWADVDSVWIAGVARKRGGMMLGVDMVKLRQRQIEAQNRASKVADSIVFT